LQGITGQTPLDIPGAALPPLLPPSSMTLAVGSVGDKLYYALSGDFTEKKVGNFLPRLQEFAGEVFVRAFKTNAVNDLNRNVLASQSYTGNTYDISECAEPKLWDLDAPESGYSGMTTLWVGTNKANPHPLIKGEVGFGSPMLPCDRCLKWSQTEARKPKGRGKRLKFRISS
jgi:hypothetical protein